MSDKNRTVRKAHLLEAIADSTTDALIAIDEAGIVVSWNRAAEKVFGYDASEMLGSTLHAVIPQRFRKSHDAGLERINSGGEHHVIGQTATLSGTRRDGSEFPIDLTLSTWTDKGRRYFGGIIRDVSERVAMERDLRASESLTRSIMETASDAIVTADDKGNIVSWNAAASEIFGYEASEMIGRSLTLIIPDKFKDAHERGIERVTGGGEHHVIGHTVELSGLHKSGRLIPVELSLSTWMNNENRFYGGIIRDITVRKEHEDRLRTQKKKLENRTRDLKRLNEEVNAKNDQLQALSNKLAKYLSQQVYKNIFEGKSDVRIESYRKKLTIFFSDIQGFTELTDRVESEVMTRALNKYLNEMADIAQKYGGTIDKYIGDAIMIFYGDPETLGEKEDAIACVKMAIEMRERIFAMHREWDVLGVSEPLRVRMGINTGFCTVGNFGSEDRLDYTIVGGSVNLASRLESAAGSDEILISQDTYSLIKDVICCKPEGEITVKGIAYPVKTYRVIDSYEALKMEDELLEASIEGFNLSVEFQKLGMAEREYALKSLKKAIAKLNTGK